MAERSLADFQSREPCHRYKVKLRHDLAKVKGNLKIFSVCINLSSADQITADNFYLLMGGPLRGIQ